MFLDQGERPCGGKSLPDFSLCDRFPPWGHHDRDQFPAGGGSWWWLWHQCSHRILHVQRAARVPHGKPADWMGLRQPAHLSGKRRMPNDILAFCSTCCHVCRTFYCHFSTTDLHRCKWTINLTSRSRGHFKWHRSTSRKSSNLAISLKSSWDASNEFHIKTKAASINVLHQVTEAQWRKMGKLCG